VSLVSAYAALYGVTEEAEARRIVIAYGLARACQVAEVLGGKACPKPHRAFWWHVGYLLSQKQNEPTGKLPREHSGYVRPSNKQPGPKRRSPVLKLTGRTPFHRAKKVTAAFPAPRKPARPGRRASPHAARKGTRRRARAS
jgi:hypothetical protein